MKAFDTDVLTEILAGQPDYVARADRIPVEEQAVPIVVMIYLAWMSNSGKL
jgi:hypothetical protein